MNAPSLLWLSFFPDDVAGGLEDQLTRGPKDHGTRKPRNLIQQVHGATHEPNFQQPTNPGLGLVFLLMLKRRTPKSRKPDSKYGCHCLYPKGPECHGRGHGRGLQGPAVAFLEPQGKGTTAIRRRPKSLIPSPV